MSEGRTWWRVIGLGGAVLSSLACWWTMISLAVFVSGQTYEFLMTAQRCILGALNLAVGFPLWVVVFV